MGRGGLQVAVNISVQKYPYFWHQAAWPKVWESHAPWLDQMTRFLDYRPRVDSTPVLAHKPLSASI